MGAAIMAVALTYFYLYRKNKTMSTKNRAFEIGAFLFLCAAQALELLPCGAVLIFADGPENKVMKTFSYFSFVPFGYANFWPLITALLTAVALALSAVRLLKKSAAAKTRDAVFIIKALALIFSLLPLMYGGEYMNTVSYAVSGSLIVSGALTAVEKIKE